MPLLILYNERFLSITGAAAIIGFAVIGAELRCFLKLIKRLLVILNRSAYRVAIS